MNSHLTPAFRSQLSQLPPDVRRQARAAYALFTTDPFHASLQFKQLKGSRRWSLRIGLGYRAVGARVGDTVLWEWIGSHAEYDRLLDR